MSVLQRFFNALSRIIRCIFSHRLISFLSVLLSYARLNLYDHGLLGKGGKSENQHLVKPEIPTGNRIEFSNHPNTFLLCWNSLNAFRGDSSCFSTPEKKNRTTFGSSVYSSVAVVMWTKDSSKRPFDNTTNKPYELGLLNRQFIRVRKLRSIPLIMEKDKYFLPFYWDDLRISW